MLIGGKQILALASGSSTTRVEILDLLVQRRRVAKAAVKRLHAQTAQHASKLLKKHGFAPTLRW